VTPEKRSIMPDFYEFFAGGGMARLGLGPGWRCLFANDFSQKKVEAYRINFPPAGELIHDDVYNLTTQDLPGQADLAWASFPCQDLSLAGKQTGLSGERSGSFWGFWRLMQQLQAEGRTIPLIVLENVVGTISVRNGKDFNVLLEALAAADYRVGPLVLNAVHWVPQSRPRLFVIGVHSSIDLPQHLRAYTPNVFLHPAALQRAFAQTPEHVREAWVWWNLPKPAHRTSVLADVIEEHPTSVRWHTEDETRRLYELMPAIHRAKVSVAQGKGRSVGTVYRRIRQNDRKEKAQVAEVRFDGVSGCLRTGSGGSSKQFIFVVEGDRMRSRLLSTREAARLMGIPDEYQLPENYSDAYHLLGDGLAVPVVAWLERKLLTPLLGENPIPISLPAKTQSPSDDADAALQLALLERRVKDS
jgi:DNA (cytosine-5)-methyltransferase 1